MSQTVRRIWHRCPFGPTICTHFKILTFFFPNIYIPSFYIEYTLLQTPLSKSLLSNETEQIKPAYKESITQLVKLSNQLREETSAMDKEIQAEVEKLGESIVNLWKIMKVVFIESSLDEIDKL